MKINRGALIFGGVVLGAVVLIALGVWFASLFTASTTGQPQKNNFFSALFPFGNPNTNTSSGTQNQDETNGQSGPAPALREISHDPVAGSRFQSNGAIRYVERETGHVLETLPDSLTITRVSNTTIPGITNVAWLGDSSFIMQYLDGNDRIKNYLATLSSSTPDQALSGVFLSEFSDVLPGADEKHIVEVARTSAGIALIASDSNEKNKKTLFTSPIRSWTLIPSGKNIYIETAPSSQVGYLYRLESDQSLTKIIGGVPGLMAVPHASSTYVAYSATGSGKPTLFIYDTTKNSVSLSPISTLAEKCAWIPGSTPLLFCGVPSPLDDVSLEYWFMGLQTFSDDAWIINPGRGTAEIIRTVSKEAGRPIDIINPQVSPDGNSVTFVNKNDLSLWSLSLHE